MKGAASESLLATLHNELTQTFLNRIKSGEVSPADLNAARQFLKDNGISCELENDPAMQELVKTIPSSEDLDGMVIGAKPQ